MNSFRWEKRSWGSMACEVSILGSADLAAGPALERLEDLLRRERDITINVDALEYADTTFLRFLMRVRSRGDSRADFKLRLRGVNPRLQRMLDVTGLSRVFTNRTSQPR